MKQKSDVVPVLDKVAAFDVTKNIIPFINQKKKRSDMNAAQRNDFFSNNWKK